MTTTTMQVLPIPADVLARWRATGRDGLGNEIGTRVADGGEPLRCCLEPAGPRQTIAVVSYSPTPVPGPWQEFGPVFIHAEACAGRDRAAGLPAAFRTGPRVLRSYAPDGSLNYDAIAVVDDGEDVEPALLELLTRDNVLEVHVRALREQCFTYAVRAG